MNKVLKWLSGKKGVIASILHLLNGYLALKGIYAEMDFVFIGTLLTILTGTASVLTKKIYK